VNYLDAKLKFLGHALEVINHARRFSRCVPTSAHENVVGVVHDGLFDVVEAIGSDGPNRILDDELFLNF
jgi:hypothetical protein